MPSDIGALSGHVEELNEQLRTGIDRCRSLVSECRSALADGTAEPNIFTWSDEVSSQDRRDHKGLDRDGESRD